MSTSDHYDTISIGSGEAGKYVCWTRSSTLGVKTAVIENKWLGGSCPNIACLPSKNFIYAADVVHNSQKYASTGLLKTGNVAVDMGAVLDRKRKMVEGLIAMHEGVFQNSGSELILGHGRLAGGKKVEVEMKDGGKRVLTADNIIICTGSRAQIDDTPGLKESQPLTHVEILELNEVPNHLVILGGGYVGIEFAQTFRRFGATVTVIERSKQILKNEDEDVAESLSEILTAEGIDILTSTSISKVEGVSGQSVTVKGERSGVQVNITGSHLLVAAGRKPNTEDIGFEIDGIELTARGHAKVNEYLQTSVPGIFAVGDCAGSPHFTHIGFDDFRIIRDFLSDKKPPRSTKNRQVPYTLYTSPELAHVGLNEKAAQQAGVKYRLAKLPMAAFLRTRTMDATEGFAKALISTIDDSILGFTALGPRAGELLPVVQLAMSAGLPYTTIANLIVTHPTLNEGLVSLFGNVPPRERSE